MGKKLYPGRPNKMVALARLIEATVLPDEKGNGDIEDVSSDVLIEVDASKLGQRLSSLREASGVSQREISDALSISLSTYRLYEVGAREITFEHALRLAAYFGVSIH